MEKINSIDELEVGLRKYFPKMFSHPEIRYGEILWTYEPVINVGVTIAYYHLIGMGSAREGGICNEEGSEFFGLYPIFIKIEEVISQKKGEVALWFKIGH